MAANHKPVGVFDSGVGGLSVLKALRQELPHEHFLYVGDSGCAPYGDRSAEFVAGRALTITECLVSNGAKAVVVACNTATAVAVESLRGRFAVPIVANYALGNVFSASDAPGVIADAIAQYERALRIKPDHFRAHYNAGTLLMDVPGRHADAIRHLESAVSIQPDSVEARVNLGVMLADEPSRSHEAIAHLEFALAKRPELAKLRELVEEIQKQRR